MISFALAVERNGDEAEHLVLYYNEKFAWPLFSILNSSSNLTIPNSLWSCKQIPLQFDQLSQKFWSLIREFLTQGLYKHWRQIVTEQSKLLLESVL